MKSNRLQRSGSRLLSPLPILLLTVFIDMVGFGIVIPVLPLYAERFGASPFTTGMLLAVYSGMGFIFSPIVGALSDRLGRRSILLLSTIGQATGFFIMGAANSLLWLFVARTIDGIFGANVSTTQAYVADVTPPEDRSRALGLLGATFGVGFIFGPLIGGVLSQISLSAPFYFAGGLAAVNAVLIFFILPESLPVQEDSRPNRDTFVTLFRQGFGPVILPLMAAYFFMMTGFSIVTAFFAIFREDRFGYNASANGYIFASIGIIGAIVQGALIGPLLKNFTEKRIAITGLNRHHRPGTVVVQHVRVAAGANGNNAAFGHRWYRGRKCFHQSNDQRISFTFREQVLAGTGPGPHAGLRKPWAFCWAAAWWLASGLQPEEHPGVWQDAFLDQQRALDCLACSNDDGVSSPVGHAGRGSARRSLRP
jgi:multidrug resistance protein